jgi:hypothetical protein
VNTLPSDVTGTVAYLRYYCMLSRRLFRSRCPATGVYGTRLCSVSLTDFLIILLVTFRTLRAGITAPNARSGHAATAAGIRKATLGGLETGLVVA